MTTIEKSGGIGVYYEWTFRDSNQACLHAHRTFDAAEKCALHTIRAARRGERFADSEHFANMPDEEASMMVHRRTYSL